MSTPQEPATKLKKELGLYDVFAVSTGAMFSSGFFLLPGLAYAKAGPAVILAYFIAGLLILPAMFSAAELSTALPRAGGAYYFLDRSLGPLAGTIGGLGTYLALTLKTAFALIGIGAYAAFFIELPIKPVAVALTIVFVLLNAMGAKETTALQRWLVFILLTVMAIFVVQAIVHFGGQPMETTSNQFEDFFSGGMLGLFSTVGFVFVSYAGLTKVASVAEEIKNPDRNIPLGMMLSLAVTSFVYVAGVAIIVGVVDHETLGGDLTPVATAADIIFSWGSYRIGLLLIVIAALAAFASTGNAGLLSASRYPYAMARDRMLPAPLSKLSKFQTPLISILMTGGLMILCIVALDAEGIAKLASAFQLFIFILINFSVIVMRESRIESYDPGYRSPFYPWIHIFGMITSSLLIVYMGIEAMLFTLAVIVGCLLWYRFYVSSRVERDGAIYHWFYRLGSRRYEGLDREFRGIMKEKGLREQDPFDRIVARSTVIDLQDEHEFEFESIVKLAAERIAQRLPNSAEEIFDRFMQGTRTGDTPVAHGVALPHFRTVSIDQSELVLVRCQHTVAVPLDDPLTPEIEPDQMVHAIFFLISPEHDPAQHLRILAQIAGRVDEDSFTDAWKSAENEIELREVLLRDDRFITIELQKNTPSSEFIGKALQDLELPEETIIAAVQRDGALVVPHGYTIVKAGDRLTILGDQAGIRTLYETYRPGSIDRLPEE